MKVTIKEASEQFPRLVEAMEQGEEVILTRGNKPVARLVPPKGAEIEKRKRKPGFLEGALPTEIVELLADNPELDREIERDFEESV